MSTGYKIIEQGRLYFVTLQVVNWIDIFTRESYRQIIIQNLEYCQQHKGLEIYAWVLMSNHLHALLRSSSDDLSGTLRDFKSFTSKKIIEEIESSNESRKDWMMKLFREAAFNHKRNSGHQFWTHENHAELIYSNKFIEQKLEYIHQNPVRAGIVARPEDYLYSSARNYAGEKGLINVIELPKLWKTVS